MAKEVDQIKEKVDLVEFLKSYMTLTPAGRNFRALCPFHPEKTPSFMVSRERKMWHCFGGCQEGGDVIKFVMKYEGLEFPEALRFLAEKAGIEMRQVNPREEREFGVLYEIHEAAKNFYESELAKSGEAKNYLKNRGLQGSTVEEFEIGYAPGGEVLTLFLIKKGFQVSDIARAGLTQRNIRGLYRDRFQFRVVFPIISTVGKTLAFTGRVLPGREKVGEIEMPKYLNSPETPIFHKSKAIYGIHKSKKNISESKSVFIVEGQMDFLMSWQSGIKNVVAVSGTALTREHVEKIRRLADVAVVSFDNDSAGMQAFERSIDIFHELDFHTKAINLGQFKDPAEACAADPDFLKKALEEAEPAMKRLFDVYFEKAGESIVHKKTAVRNALSKIRKMKSVIEQDVWIQKLARQSGVGEGAIRQEFGYGRSQEEVERDTSSEVKSRGNGIERHAMVARRLLALAFTNDEFLSIVRENQKWLPAQYAELLYNTTSEVSTLLELEGELLKEESSEKNKEEFEELMLYLEFEALKKEREKIRFSIKEADKKKEEQVLIESVKNFSEVNTRIVQIEKTLAKVI